MHPNGFSHCSPQNSLCKWFSSLSICSLRRWKKNKNFGKNYLNWKKIPGNQHHFSHISGTIARFKKGKKFFGWKSLNLFFQELLQADFEGVLKFFRVNLPRKYRTEVSAKELIHSAVKLKVEFDIQMIGGQYGIGLAFLTGHLKWFLWETWNIKRKRQNAKITKVCTRRGLNPNIVWEKMFSSSSWVEWGIIC